MFATPNLWSRYIDIYTSDLLATALELWCSITTLNQLHVKAAIDAIIIIWLKFLNLRLILLPHNLKSENEHNTWTDIAWFICSSMNGSRSARIRENTWYKFTVCIKSCSFLQIGQLFFDKLTHKQFTDSVL